MKRFFVLLFGAMMLNALHAQVVQQGEPAVVYYSPKTTVVLDFTYTVETQQTGPYAEYAEAMLGIDNAIMENKTVHTLTNVLIGTTTGADYNRPHKVVAELGFPMLLSINEKSLLVGYNLPPTEKQQPIRKHEAYQQPRVLSSITHTEVAPYPEEVLEAATPLAQANAIAKQIFHIRETRMYLLSGEVEHAPADGKAMNLVLDELNKQEYALTELFIGKKYTITEHKSLFIIPEKEEEFFFFSEENGFTDADNIDADTIKVKLIADQQTFVTVPENGKKKKGTDVSQLVYNLPGSCEITVDYKNQTMAQRTIPVAQFGIDVPLSKDLFTGSELPQIVFSEKTGNIVSISK